MSAQFIHTSIMTFPIVEATHSQRFTSGSRFSAGHDDDATEAGLRLNQWFIDHPELVLGQIGMVRLHNQLWQSVTAPESASVAELLATRLAAAIPHDLFRTDQSPIRPLPTESTASQTPRQQALYAVYTAAKALLSADASAAPSDALRQTLNQVYDICITQYGCLHGRANQQALRGQPELYFLRALETNVHEEGTTLVADKAAIFFGPTLRPTPQVVIGSMTPDEALLRCLNDRGAVDLATIAYYSGQSEAACRTALIGRIYCNPASGQWETADQYLSGNIRTKLIEAQAFAQDERFVGNAAALQAVLPTALGPEAIRACLGAPWIPASDIRDFIITLIPRFAGERSFRGSVVYHAPLAKWEIHDPAWSRTSHEATVTWGTSRMHALEIISCALNGTPPVVYDIIDTDSAEKRIVNQQETLVAQEKWQQIGERFAQWIWGDPERTERLCASYNQRFNSMRRRDFDGQHLLLPGMNRTILRGGDLLPHQKDAVWCALQQQTTLLDLCVGAGKTFIGLAWAHEVRRLGLASKVLITVPNHLVEQWGVEANRLYPDLRVLVMSPEDFTARRRGEFLSRIVTESYDLIICAHTSFGFIEPGQVAHDFISREVAKLRTFLDTLRHGSERENRLAIKAVAKKIQAFTTTLQELEHQVRHDSARTITWSELGIDALLVDESHEFKNLPIATSMNVAGVPKGESKRAFDMRVKTWDILRRGGKIVFATGTPILNSIGEAFIMQTYLAEPLLEAAGVAMFDAWARTFAEAVPVFEMTPDGGGFRVHTRLARFVNLPELFQIWFQCTFSRSREQLGLPTPVLMDQRRIGVRIPASPRLRAYVQQLVARVEAIKAGQVDPHVDNMLKVVSDGAKAALDTRLVMGDSVA